MIIIKKEDIKEDIKIKFDKNVVYGVNNMNALIKFDNGVLSIDLTNLTIASNDIVEKVIFKEDFLNSFK